MGIKDLFNKVKNKILPQNDKSVSASEYTIEDEIATMESYTTPKGYIMEDNLRNQHKEDRSPLLSLRVHLIIWGYGDEKLPTNYFCQLVDRLNNAICKDTFAYDYVIDMLCKQAKTFIMDENGEVSDRKNKLSSKEIISLSDNPVLEYASKFNYFEFADDIYGTVDNKRIVFMKVILFLAINSGADESVPVNRNILKDNPWLLDKNTYYNKLDMVKDEKSFSNIATKCPATIVLKSCTKNYKKYKGVHYEKELRSICERKRKSSRKRHQIYRPSGKRN